MNRFQDSCEAARLKPIVTISEYIAQLKKNLAQGDATEHTYRPALKALLESYSKGITATNEPKRIACGAPDFSVRRKTIPLGHVETKDVGTNLDEIERGRGPHGEQFKRYIAALPNWILTDYLEFRWYVNGEKRLTVQLGSLDGKKKIHTTPTGADEVSHLLEAFLTEPALTVETAKDLAQRMAGMTRVVRDLIAATFQHGSVNDRKQLENWITAFREVLIPDLDEQQFADMFAQTLAYGLFAARVHSLDSGKPFTREMAAFSLPKTNPFLRKLFSEIAGVDMPDTFGWAVDDLVLLLNHANWGKVLEDFGKGKAKHDPVVHFYETFLTAYDPEVRELRGVYYTPEPVVGYIVRSIDDLLQKQFDKPDGMADEKTLILDPAVGTATFLFFVIQQIYARFAEQAGAWDGYVSDHLLNRVFGFELLMAPYAVAHLKLSMELQDTGYKFDSEQRLGIYLTNTLEEAARKTETLFAQWISDEANAAAEIKRDRPILVILGNPPYSGVSANRSKDEKGNLTFIGNLIEDYKKVDGKSLKERKHWLQDDYVKFIRFAQWRIDRTGYGLLGFITNHGYLDNPTFRGMRQNLMSSFSELYVYNLHGNSKKKEKSPDGEKDENVFDIQQGVAILLAIKHPGQGGLGKVYHCDLWGTRESKYATLDTNSISTTTWQKITPSSPLYLFIPEDKQNEMEYQSYWSLADVMPVKNTGVITARDGFIIDFEDKEIEKRVKIFLNTELSDEDVRSQLDLNENYAWRVAEARKQLGKVKNVFSLLTDFLYRPFDKRRILYHDSVVWRTRHKVMRHMLGGTNFGLITTRLTKDKWDCFVTDSLMGHKALAAYDINYLFPAFILDSSSGLDSTQQLFSTERPNISAKFLCELSNRLGIRQEQPSQLPDGISAEQIFGYTYAIFHSLSYRARYAEFLKRDFPRLPLTSDAKLLAVLSDKGQELIKCSAPL